MNCHAIEKNGKPIPALPFGGRAELVLVKQGREKGCLDPLPSPGKSPVYKLDNKERLALVAFVKDGLTGAGSAAPAYQAHVALKRFNCLNCHQRDGEGGIPVELADQMRQLEKAENADDVRPPVLTGIGHKTRTVWLKSVLTQSGRARPWMQLRMPQYGEPNVAFLPEALASLEGTVPDDKVHMVERTAAKLAAGRNIVGKGGLGCISCHDISGHRRRRHPRPGPRHDQPVACGTIGSPVGSSQPQRMAPGTQDAPGRSSTGNRLLKTVFDGDGAQAGSTPSGPTYSLGPGLPLPRRHGTAQGDDPRRG